jgi:hypothetical protein
MQPMCLLGLSAQPLVTRTAISCTRPLGSRALRDSQFGAQPFLRSAAQSCANQHEHFSLDPMQGTSAHGPRPSPSASKQVSTSARHRSSSAAPGTRRSLAIGRFEFSCPGARRFLELIFTCHACPACSRLSLIASFIDRVLACLLVRLFACGSVCLVVGWHVCRPVLHIMISRVTKCWNDCLIPCLCISSCI